MTRPGLDLLRYAAAQLLGSALAYVYVLLAGRWLSLADFGIFSTLLGLLTLGGIYATGLQVAVTQLSARTPPSLGALLQRCAAWLLLPAGLATAVLLLWHRSLGLSPVQALLGGAIFLAMLLSALPMGVLGGCGRVRQQAELNAWGALGRLLLGAALILAGLRVAGALAAYLLNYLLLAWAAWHLCQRGVDTAATQQTLPLNRRALLAVLVGFLPFTLDQLLVARLAPTLLGEYAALATVAKLSFFASFPLTAYVYPALLASPGQGPRRRLLTHSFAGVLLISGGISLLVALGPSLALGYLFGQGLQTAASALPLLALGTSCFSLSALLIHALIVWGQRHGHWASVLALLPGAGLFFVRHDNLVQLVQNQAGLYGLQLLLLSLLMVRTLRRETAAARVGGH
jgi:O-antigen/teichoic acid export membrane protein